MSKFTDVQLNRLSRFFMMSDSEFYVEYVADAPLEEQAEFMNAFPGFLSDGRTGNRIKKKTDLKEDKMYQEIMKRIG